MAEKRRFSIILLRSESLCEQTGEDYGKDVYVAQITATDIYSAIDLAKKEVYKSDTRDGLSCTMNDYTLCVALLGPTDVALFGWQ